MKVRLLGTAAAEGIPAFLSSTRVSDYAREHGGKDVRTRSGALIDGCLKIDLPPDTLLHIHRDRLDARDWTAMLITHSDDDHFAIKEIQYGLYPFSAENHLTFAIYGNEAICRMLACEYPNWPIEVVETRSFQTFQQGPYIITPIRSHHIEDEDSQNFLIERDGKVLLYGTDTGIWQEPTWDFLKGWTLDGLVIECTEGLNSTSYWGHLDADETLAVVNRLREMGCVSANTFITTTHHSHNGNATHAELEAFFNPHGIQVGYDGMEFEV